MSFGDLFAPIVASVMTLAFIFAMFKGRKHAALPESLQDPSFQLKDLYIVGLAWEDMIPALSYRSGLSDKIKPSVQMLYGEKYAEYYTRMYLAKIITYTQLVMTALALAAASGSEEMRKFSMSIIQSMEKGNAELSRIMMQQATELWSLKKQRLLQRGEKAATKLVIPVSLMFVGVIIVVLTCALSGLSL